MLYTDISLLERKINQISAGSKPFFFVVNYEQTEGYLVENPISQSEVFFRFPTIEHKPFAVPSAGEIEFKVIPNEPESYRRKFDKLQEYLNRQEISFANLTERTKIETNLSLENIFSLCESLYQIYIPGKFVCFSPERFVKIANGKISTNPMKGTIDANIPNAEQIILEDKKELDEHSATVKLLSEELGIVSDNVGVTRFRYIDRLKTNRKDLLQVSSEIVGELPADYRQHIGTTLFSLLPGGSIAGEPKQRALEILQEIENRERNYYCGIAGYFDGSALDTAVLIRFIEQETGNLYFRSGGGITANSICENEYQEVLNKVYLPFCGQKPVFVESLRIENGKIYNLDIHRERMQNTAFLHYGTKPVLQIDLSAIPPDLPNGRIKCRVLYAADIAAVEFHAYRLKEIKSLRLIEDNSIEYSHKTINRDALNSLFAQRNGADDIIIIKNGKITDSSSANLVFESFEGELFTPKTYLLAGTKRALLLKNGTIKEQDISVGDLPLYRKVYLISAMVDLEDNVSVPVSSIIM